MAEQTLQGPAPAAPRKGGNTKFLIGGFILLAAVAYLIISNLASGQEYFITVDDLLARRSELAGRSARVSGVVLGDTIEYDGQTLSFVIANVPDSISEVETEGGLADVLHEAANNPDAQRLTVVLYDEPKPDLLRHEAQAIVTGKLGDDGVFYADELLLKCPTRYEEAVPEQADAGGSG